MDKKYMLIPINNVIGLIIIIFYLINIRLYNEPSIYLFIFGVFACSISLVLSYYYFPKSYIYSILSLFLLSYCMLTFYNFRYDVLGGEDIIGEYKIALETTVSERWPWELMFSGSGDRPGRYASCLSVTILPAVLSKVMGIDVLSLFRFVMPIIGAFLPLIVFILIRDVFDSDKFAILTSMLFAVGRLYSFSLSYMYREIIGYILLLMALHSILKLKNTPLAIILLSGVVFSSAGHVSATSGFIILSSYMLSSFLSFILKKDEGTSDNLIISPIYLIYYFTITTLWLRTFSSPKLTQITSRIFTLIPLIMRIPNYVMKVLSTWDIFPRGSPFSGGLPVSGILNYWYYAYVIITAVGLFYSVIRYMTDNKKITLIISGSLMFLLFVMSVLSPWNIPELQAHRIISYPLLTPFLAITFRIPKKLSVRLYNFKLVIPVTLLYLFLSMPMNLNLVDHQRILHYHHENNVNPEYSVAYPNTDYPEIILSDWISSYITENQKITTDFRGSLITYLSGHLNRHTKSYPSFNLTGSNFLILHDFFIKDGLWRTGLSRAGVYPSRNVTLPEVLTEGDVVYSSGKYILLMN